MKVKASVKKMCEHCYMAKRTNARGQVRLYVYCKRNQRHKQRQG